MKMTFKTPGNSKAGTFCPTSVKLSISLAQCQSGVISKRVFVNRISKFFVFKMDDFVEQRTCMKFYLQNEWMIQLQHKKAWCQFKASREGVKD